MQRLKNIIYPACAVALISLLSAAEIYNMRPFATGAFTALAATSLPLTVLAPSYFVLSCMHCTDVSEVLGYASITASVCLAKLIACRLRRSLSPIVSALVGAVAAVGFIWAATLKVTTPLNVLLTAVFSATFSIVVHTFSKLVLSDGTFTEIEWVCGCTVLAAGSIALAEPIVGKFSLVYAAAAYITLVMLYAHSVGGAIASAVSVGVGAALKEFDYFPIAVFSLAGCIACVFAGGKKQMTAAGYMLGFTSAVFLLGRGEIEWVISGALGTTLFLATPARLFHRRDNYGLQSAIAAAYRYRRKKAGDQTELLADIFGRMSNSCGRKRTVEIDTDGYARRLIGEVCTVCSRRDDCPCLSVTYMEELIKAAFDRGKTSAVNMPDDILKNCSSIGKLTDKINEYTRFVFGAVTDTGDVNKATEFVGDQFAASKQLLGEISFRLKKEVEQDFKGAEAFRTELVYGGCDCKACIAEKNGEQILLSAVVAGKTLDLKRAIKAAEKVFGKTFHVITSGEGGEYANLLMRSGNFFDVVFGVANASKDRSGVTGDVHAFSKVGGSGCLVALFDGMGSGRAASEIGTAAVSLTEDYFRAGFSPSFAISAVNRFFTLKRSESFVAADICLIDLENGRGSIIKAGCPNTILKREGKVAFIGAGSLPIGTVEEMTPYIKDVELRDGDMIVMSSDGVADAFSIGEEERLVASCDTANPQMLSEYVLGSALSRYGGNARDDMTVVCARLFRP